MDDSTAAETTAATLQPYPDDLIARIRAEVLEQLAEEGPAAPEFREIENNLKPWAGEGSPPNLLMRLCSVMGEVGSIPKSGKHAKHGYAFATVDDVVGKIRPLFAQHGIWPNIRVVSREYQAFKTSGDGIGYNGNLVYACSLYNSHDPSDNVTWEMAGLVTNPGEKLDWVAQSQFYKYFLFGALCLDRGDDDADSNPGDGPRDLDGAMQRRGRGPRQQSAPPPSEPKAAAKPATSTWDTAWLRVREQMQGGKPGANPPTKAAMDQLYTKAAEQGWDTDMVRIMTLRLLGVRPDDMPWTVAERVAWIFGNFKADQHFYPPTSEETAPGGLLAPKPQQAELLEPPAESAPAERKKR